MTARSDTQHTALHYAARPGRAKHVGLLLENGAEIEAANEDGRTALIESGALVDLRDNKGVTALHLAVDRSDRRILESLISHKE